MVFDNVLSTMNIVKHRFDDFLNADVLSCRPGMSNIRPCKAFNEAPRRNFNKLKPRDSFSPVLDGIDIAGSPSFYDCLGCQIENIR